MRPDAKEDVIDKRRISKLTLRDMPVLCLLIAAWAVMATLGCLALARDAEPPPRGELLAVSGQVIDTFWKKTGKGHSEVHVLIQAADGLHDCASGTSPVTSKLLNLPKGTAVAALVLEGSIASPADRLWSLRSGNVALLEYERLAEQATQSAMRASLAARGFGLFAMLSFVTALILRRRFGGWREPAPKAVLR